MHHSSLKDARIPIACIPLEEAELMKRLYNRNKKIVVEMRIKSRMEGTCTSRNTIFDIKGWKKIKEVINIINYHFND